jgi:hypothetical protein
MRSFGALGVDAHAAVKRSTRERRARSKRGLQNLKPP